MHFCDHWLYFYRNLISFYKLLICQFVHINLLHNQNFYFFVHEFFSFQKVMTFSWLFRLIVEDLIGCFACTYICMAKFKYGFTCYRCVTFHISVLTFRTLDKQSTRVQKVKNDDRLNVEMWSESDIQFLMKCVLSIIQKHATTRWIRLYSLYTCVVFNGSHFLPICHSAVDLKQPYYRSHASDFTYHPMKMVIAWLWSVARLLCMLQAIWLDEKDHNYIYHMIIYWWHKITHVTCNRVTSDLPRCYISVRAISERSDFNQIGILLYKLIWHCPSFGFQNLIVALDIVSCCNDITDNLKK